MQEGKRRKTGVKNTKDEDQRCLPKPLPGSATRPPSVAHAAANSAGELTRAAAADNANRLERTTEIPLEARDLSCSRSDLSAFWQS